jgi:hypothetical protein
MKCPKCSQEMIRGFARMYIHSNDMVMFPERYGFALLCFEEGVGPEEKILEPNLYYFAFRCDPCEIVCIACEHGDINKLRLIEDNKKKSAENQGLHQVLRIDALVSQPSDAMTASKIVQLPLSEIKEDNSPGKESQKLACPECSREMIHGFAYLDAQLLKLMFLSHHLEFTHLYFEKEDGYEKRMMEQGLYYFAYRCEPCDILCVASDKGNISKTRLIDGTEPPSHNPEYPPYSPYIAN